VFIVFVELTECTDFWNNFAPPIQYLLICFGLTYFTALLCLSLTISWSVRNFNAGCSCLGAKKKTGTDCFAFKFCSWWCNGIYEEWKPEILGCRRHISPGPVLRTHSTPSETCLCIINWFRYAESFFFSDPLAIFFAWKFDQPGFLTWHHCWFRVPGISAALLSVMGSRFKKSRKIFPAGVVSLVSLVMVGGYFHGILRSSHAWCSQLQSHHLRFTLQSLLSFLFHHAISLPFGVLESYGTVSVSSCTGFEQAFCVHVEVGFVFYFVALVSVFVDVCLISDLHYRIVNPLS